MMTLSLPDPGAAVASSVMSVHSAGLLLYRFRDTKPQIFLVHPGGPYWVNKDDGAWSLPKGLIGENETPLEAARREFQEETGFTAEGRFSELGQLKQPGGKIVHAWALEKDINAHALKSNNFTLEWPKGSGMLREFPEVDRGGWFSIDQARIKITRGQARFIDRLLELLSNIPKNI